MALITCAAGAVVINVSIIGNLRYTGDVINQYYLIRIRRIKCWAQYRTKQAVHSPAVAIAAREPSWCQSVLMLTLCIFGMTEVINISIVG